MKHLESLKKKFSACYSSNIDFITLKTMNNLIYILIGFA